MEPTKKQDTFTIQGDWNIQKEELKKKYTELTDEDVKFETGKEDELLERLGKKLNKNRDEVISDINSNHTQKA